MLTEDRHNFIRQVLATKGQVLAVDLVAQFGVSEDTARRDLRELTKAGQCQRVYGGAVAIAPHSSPLAIRNMVMSEEKRRIAKCAITLIKPGQSLFIDGGSTNTTIAQAIPRNMPLTVTTNALGVANALSAHTHIKLVLLGGVYDQALGTCVGTDALRRIKRLNADLLLLGSCGIAAKSGVSAFDEAEAEIKRAMAERAAAIIVAATNDKLETTAPFQIVHCSSITHLVVDQRASTVALARFRKLGIKIHIALG
jgi:DeoR/GlpR family transcriptional regulator of sugar metabolism